MDKAMTPTQPPAAEGASARDVIAQVIGTMSVSGRFDDMSVPAMRTLTFLYADGILSALAEAGLVIVSRDDVSDALWAIGSRQTNDRDTVAAYERLSAALAKGGYRIAKDVTP